MLGLKASDPNFCDQRCEIHFCFKLIHHSVADDGFEFSHPLSSVLSSGIKGDAMTVLPLEIIGALVVCPTNNTDVGIPFPIEGYSPP